MRQLLGLGGRGRDLDRLRLVDRRVHVGHVEVEAHLPVAVEDQPLLAFRLVEHGGHEGAGDHVGVLDEPAVGEVQAEDVLRPFAVRGEVDPLAVGGERGVVLVRLARRQLVADPRLVEVDAEDLVAAAGGRDEDQRAPVGGEDRRAVIHLVVGEVGDRLGGEVEEEDVELAVAPAGEGDRPAVRRKGGGHLLLDVGQVDDLAHAAVQHVDQQEAAPPLALGEDGDGVAVRREAEVAPQLAADGQLLGHQVLVVVREAVGQVAEQLARLGVVEDEVGLAAVAGDRGDQVAGRRGDRRDGFRPLRLPLPDPEDVAEVRGLARPHQLRQVLPAQPAPELDVEVLRLHLEGPLDRAVHPGAQGVADLVDEVEEPLLAPALLDEVEHRVAEAVGEEAGEVRARHRGDDVVDHRVAQVHPVALALVLRHVARHALQEPGGRTGGDRAGEAPLEEHLELEDVRHLVQHELHQLRVREVDRHDHAELRRAGEGAHPLGDEAELHVVLLERRVGGVIE